MSHSTLFEKTVTTRKPHRCEACSTVFPAGSKLRYYKAVQDGEHYYHYYCQTCLDLRDLLDIDWSDGVQESQEAAPELAYYLECPRAIDRRCQYDLSYCIDDVDLDFIRGTLTAECVCSQRDDVFSIEALMVPLAQMHFDERMRLRDERMWLHKTSEGGLDDAKE